MPLSPMSPPMPVGASDPFRTPPRAARSLDRSMEQAAGALADEAMELSDSCSETSSGDWVSVGQRGGLFSDVAATEHDVLSKRVADFVDPTRIIRSAKESNTFELSEIPRIKADMVSVAGKTYDTNKKRRASLIEGLQKKRTHLKFVNEPVKAHMSEVMSHMRGLDAEVTNTERALHLEMQMGTQENNYYEKQIHQANNLVLNKKNTITLLDTFRTEGTGLVHDLYKTVVELETKLEKAEVMSNTRLEALGMYAHATKSLSCDICFNSIGFGNRVFNKTMCNHIICDTCYNQHPVCSWNYCVKRNAAGSIIFDANNKSKKAKCHFAYTLSATDVLEDVFESCDLITKEFFENVGAGIDHTKEVPPIISDFHEKMSKLRKTAHLAPIDL
jgi:hypothetical protein